MLNSISRKVIAGYAAIALVLAIVVVMLFGKLDNIATEAEKFSNETLPRIQAVKQASSEVNQVMIAAYGLYGFTVESERFAEIREQNLTNLQGILSRLPKIQGFDVDELERLSANLSQLQRIMTASEVDWDGARDTLTILQRQAQSIEESLLQIEQRVSMQVDDRVADIQSDIGNITLWLMLSFVVIAIIVIVAFGFTRKTIVQPVKGLSAQLDHIVESHDLRQNIEVESNDEVGVAARSVNELIVAYRHVNSQIADSAKVLNSSIDLLDHSAQLSDEQILQLAQVVETMLNSAQQLDASISETAARSEVTADKALVGAEQVQDGSNKIENTSEIISELSRDIEKSADMLLNLKHAGDKVSDVVKTIADIAEQTNLLALNAAIEAARAGESGRGFAVVAGEVRTLASRTHESTYEINSILEEIVRSISDTVGSMEGNKQKANDAVNAAHTTVSSLKEIKDTVLVLSQENQDLAQLGQASQNEVNQIRVDIDNIQDAMVSVKETSAETRLASSRINELVAGLKQVLEQFKT